MIPLFGVVSYAIWIRKDPQLAFFVILMSLLGTGHKFYGAISEIWLCLPVLALLMLDFLDALANRKKLKWPHWIILSIILFFAHPFLLLSAFIGTILIYLFFISKQNLNFLWIPSMIAIFIAIKRYLLPTDSYESQNLEMLTLLKEVFFEPEKYKVLEISQNFIMDEYPLVLVGLVVFIVLAFSRGFWKINLAVLVSAGSVFVLTMGRFSYLDTEIFFLLEGYLAVALSFLSLPAYLLLRKSELHWTLIFLVMVLVFISLQRIWDLREIYQDRIQQFEVLLEDLEQNESSVGFVTQDEFDWVRMYYPWSIAYETTLLSGIQDGKCTKNVAVNEYNVDYNRRINEGGFLLIPFDTLKLIDLNPQFFNIPNSKPVELERPW